MRIIDMNSEGERAAIDAEKLIAVGYDGRLNVICYFDHDAKELNNIYLTPAAARLAYDALLSQWRGPQPQPVEPPSDAFMAMMDFLIRRPVAQPTPAQPATLPDPWPLLQEAIDLMSDIPTHHRMILGTAVLGARSITRVSIGSDDYQRDSDGKWQRVKPEAKGPEPLFVGEVPADGLREMRQHDGKPVEQQPTPVRPFSVFPQKPAAVPPKKPSLADKLWEKSTDQVRKAMTLAEAIRTEQPLDAAQEVPPEAGAAAKVRIVPDYGVQQWHRDALTGISEHVAVASVVLYDGSCYRRSDVLNNDEWSPGTPDPAYGKPPVELTDKECGDIAKQWDESFEESVTEWSSPAYVRFIAAQLRAKGAL